MRGLVVYIVVALSFAIDGTVGNLSLFLSNSCPDDYKSFIQQLRKELTVDTDQLYGIPILKNSVSNSQRFYLVDLVNESYETITLAIDVENLGAVAYRARNSSYFFSNAPKIASKILFSTTNQNILDFNSTYESIENAGRTRRSETPLGVDPIESAISNLYEHQRELVPASFLVIIQMVLEASKFKFIEQSVANSIRDANSFTPSLAIVSLEDNWSELCAQIQASKSLQGVFGNGITLYNSKNESIEVDSIYYPLVIANVALQLNRADGSVRPTKFIRMPGVGASDDACNIQASTTHISGREGLCADVADGRDYDGNRIILYKCGLRKDNQKWRFQSDGTIRSLNKCLTTNTSSFGNSVVIYNCDKADPNDIYWEVSVTGTITNPSYKLVLTANASESKTNLSVEANTYAASQGWRVGYYVNPIIASIIGFQEMCLEATNKSKNVWLERCVKNKTEQYWAVYSDGSIRVNENRELCVTALEELITIVGCNGSSAQRWVFMADGTILNPQTYKRMDVAESKVFLKKIILNSKTDKPNQKWLLFY